MNFIEIVGSNSQNIKLITENFIDDIIETKKLTYNVLKNKYLTETKKMVIPKKIKGSAKIDKDNKDLHKHIQKQLIKNFYYYNDELSYEENIENFIDYINYINSGINIIDYINNFINLNNIFDKLNICLKKIYKKIFGNEDKLNKTNYYINLKFLIKYFNEINNSKLNLLKKKLQLKLNKLQKLLDDIDIYKLKKSKNKLDINDNNLLKNIVKNIDIIIYNNKTIKPHLIEIDKLMNQIIEILYKILLEL